MEAQKRTYKTEQEILPLFFRGLTKLHGIGCHDATITVECDDKKVTNISVKVMVSISTLEQIVKELYFFTEITIPELKPHTLIEIFLNLVGMRELCKKLTEELVKHPDKNPAEVLIYRPKGKLLPFQELVWYDLDSWMVKETRSSL